MLSARNLPRSDHGAIPTSHHPRDVTAFICLHFLLARSTKQKGQGLPEVLVEVLRLIPRSNLGRSMPKLRTIQALSLPSCSGRAVWSADDRLCVATAHGVLVCRLVPDPGGDQRPGDLNFEQNLLLRDPEPNPHPAKIGVSLSSATAAAGESGEDAIEVAAASQMVGKRKSGEGKQVSSPS